MAQFTLQSLNDEIVNDPEGIGYKEVGGEWKGDQVIADLINAKNLKIDVEELDTSIVRSTCSLAAYDGLGIDKQEWLRWMTPAGARGIGLKVTADVKLQLTGRTMASNGAAGTGSDNNSFWAAADDQDMAPAFLAIIEVDGSRAEVLWGDGQNVTASQVGAAANL